MTILQVVTWPVERLIPYARNARTHSDEQVTQIAASMAEFGWTNPILAGSDGIIVAGHARLAQAIVPLRIAAGEHVPNRVVFKNYLQARALHFVQADCCRLGGVSEYITVSLLARKYGLPVVPHAGDMGQIHQSLVLFDHIALDAPVIFLEHIPHVRAYLVHPARVEDGVYRTPQAPGCACDLKELNTRRA